MNNKELLQRTRAMLDSLEHFIAENEDPSIFQYTTKGYGWLTKCFINGSLITEEEDDRGDSTRTVTGIRWQEKGIRYFVDMYDYIDRLLPFPIFSKDGRHSIETTEEKLVRMREQIIKNIKSLESWKLNKKTETNVSINFNSKGSEVSSYVTLRN